MNNEEKKGFLRASSPSFNLRITPNKEHKIKNNNTPGVSNLL